MDGLGKTRWIVERGRSLGFDLCGVARAERWPELEHLPEWLARGYAGEMKYLAQPRRAAASRDEPAGTSKSAAEPVRNAASPDEPVRNDPGLLLEGARSVIVAALNYNAPQPRSTEFAASQSARDVATNGATNEESADASDGSAPRGWISRYAWGDDYHEVIGAKLSALLDAMRGEFAEPFEARWHVDTGPIVERVAAKHAGLGWLAKNTCLINENLGSWLFLGVIVTTLDLAPSLGPGNSPAPDRCGSCTACLDACPTGAFPAPYVMDARRCISYLTIELRGAIPEEFRAAIGANVIGCDICQDVCPWNRKAPVTFAPQFQPRSLAPATASMDDNAILEAAAVSGAHKEDSLFAPPLEKLAGLTQAEFSAIFRASAVKRAKWRGLVRNACVALGNASFSPGSEAHRRAAEILERLAAGDDALVAEHARWALGSLRVPTRKN